MNQLVISPVHDEAGALIYYFASQKDITAQRRAEALEKAERLLLKEVDHRAMNALAIVKSIVSLTKVDTAERYAASVRARVDALARAHRLLATSGWTGAQLGALLAMEVPAGFSDRVETSGPPVLLPAQRVQPVTLVLHELMANAVQHGALADQGGRVAICWESHPDRVAVQWRERGGPRPSPVPRPGFGLMVTEGVIVRQLRGKLELHWTPGGLDAVLILPTK